MTVNNNNNSTNKVVNAGPQTAASNGSTPIVQFVVAKEMWIYVATTVPMLLLTIAAYTWFERRVQRERQLFSRTEMSQERNSQTFPRVFIGSWEIYFRLPSATSLHYLIILS